MSPEAAVPAAGIVLAAGLSSRMGENKLLMEVDGESLLRRTVSRALAAGLAPVIVVLGHQAGRIRAELEGLACETVFNPDYTDGIGSSLKAGVAALPATTEIAISQLADMPHVTSAMLRELAERYRDTGAPLVLSDYEGVTAPPFLYHRELFSQIGELPGHCDQRVIKRNRDRAVVVRWPASALEDVDEPGDLEYARNRLAIDSSSRR